MEGNVNYYEILGVSVHASAEEITAAKLALAKVYHPDANIKEGVDTTEQMQLILEAYRTLSDPDRRAKYDRELLGQRGERERRMQTYDLHTPDDEQEQSSEPNLVTCWRASNTLYDIVTESSALYRTQRKSARLGQLALQALRPIVVLKNAQIPDRYWHPDVMNWVLFTWFQNRNYTTSYILTMYDNHVQEEYGRADLLRMKHRTKRYQHSVSRLLKY